MAGSSDAKLCAHLQWLPTSPPASCAAAVAGFERPGSLAGEQQARRPRPPLPDHLKLLLEECRPLYTMLKRHAMKPLRASSSVPRPLGAADGGDTDGSTGISSSGGECVQAGDAAAGRDGEQHGSSDGKQQHGGTHVYEADPRNADILIGMRDGVTGARVCGCAYVCICGALGSAPLFLKLPLQF